MEANGADFLCVFSIKLLIHRILHRIIARKNIFSSTRSFDFGHLRWGQSPSAWLVEVCAFPSLRQKKAQG
jgi:hypothetical protein